MLDGFETIDRSAPEPIYQQIKRVIAERIGSGEWSAGEKLPSENELVAALDVSRMTINRALRELAEQGLVRRVHGLGSFVAEAPRHASLIELRDIAQEIEAQGKTHSSRVLRLASVPAEASIAAQLELTEGDPVALLQAVHYQDEQPIQLETRYVNPALIPGFLEQDFTRITATAYLLTQVKPDEMEHRVRAVLADAECRRQLGLGAGEPCLQLRRRTWKAGRVVTRVTLTWPGDRYELGARYATDAYRRL